uniref:mitogen-activated protein kinase kinase kinase n=1 Tax=Salix viminalis TaxID=40686 RepID=A0A6N2L0W0_SALVM
MSSPMPSSSTQAACSSSSSFSHYAEAFAQYAIRLVQTLRQVVEAAAPSAAGYCARLPIGQVLRSAENTARTILRKLGRPIQNEENNARGNRYSDVNSPALKISRPRPRITNWERGVLIGKGSFASVYKGYSNEDGIFFAAKGVSPTEPNHLRHLENEIAILKLLDDHENIIQYYGTDKDGEMVYIFLELASHGTLEQAYKNCRFEEPQVSHYTRQILLGLKYLHSCKVVHGDLNCANILVTEPGTIKLADFGLSKRMEDHSYGFPSDICSLGCTVLEMSTRKYPQSNAKKVLISEELAIRSGRGIIPDPNQRPTAAKLLAHPFVKESSFHADS